MLAMEGNLTKRERRTTAPSKAKTSSPLSDKTLRRGRQPGGGGDRGLRRLREAAHARGGPRPHHRGRRRRRRRAAHPRHLGKKHVFLSEGTRQHLEDLRNEKRNQAATTAQRIWRGYTVKKKWPNLRRNLQAQLVAQRSSRATRPRPQPISGTPPPEAMHNGNFVDKSRQQIPLTMPDEVIKSMPGHQDQNNSLGMDRCDFKIIQKTCSLFGLDLVSTWEGFID